MGKYYICNNIRFLTGMSLGATNPSCGTHMKKTNALAFIEQHPEYSYYKTRNSSKGNDYVVSTAMRFIGHDGNVVSTIQQAQSFSSPDDAFSYLDAHLSTIDRDINTVIDEKFVRQRRPSKQKLAELEPAEVFSIANMDNSDRINIPRDVKISIYKKSGGICPICGGKLSQYNYTIDHIVPLSRGGTNDAKNLRAVHKECNRLKGSFTDNELLNVVNKVACNNLVNNSMKNKMMINSSVNSSVNSAVNSAVNSVPPVGMMLLRTFVRSVLNNN